MLMVRDLFGGHRFLLQLLLLLLRCVWGGGHVRAAWCGGGGMCACVCVRTCCANLFLLELLASPTKKFELLFRSVIQVCPG